MNEKKELSTHAAAAKQIRKILKAEFPEVKFQVKSKSYSGGNSIDVYYTNGPIRKDVEKHLYKFQQGHFNGMEDIYEYSNVKEDTPQVKYLFVNRAMSEGAELAIANEVDKHYKTDGPVFNNDGTINRQSRFGDRWMDSFILSLFHEREYAPVNN